MTRHALTERQLLCDSLDRIGADAPTLCEGWQTQDLAAHLYVREHRPDLAAGLFVSPLAERLEREQKAIADGGFDALVEKVRDGAPAWNPTRLAKVDELVNLVEMFVHHEDILRAQPDWTARPLSDEVQAALWTNLKRSSRMLFRKSPTGIVLIGQGQGRHAAKLPDERGTVVLRGEPAELVLYAFGRKDVAAVELEGDPADVAALQETGLGA
ncbi:MAG: TIGR03085 family metal-binding protein [Terracoccus sp.]